MNTDSCARAGSRRGLLLILLAALLWGTVGIASKAIYGTTDTNAVSIGFFRLAIAAPLLLAGCWRARITIWRIAWRDLRLMIVIGVMMALYQVTYFAAIPRIGVAVSTLITLCTAPVIVALLAATLLGERLTRRVVLALFGGLAGTALLSWTGEGTDAGRSELLVGAALALTSSFGYSVMTLCSRALAGRYHPLQPMTIGLGVGAVLLLPCALIAGMTLSYPLTGWLLLFYLGAVPTALAFAAFLAGMRDTQATVASIITLLEPLMATLYAWLLFGERLGPLGLAGAALLLGAIGLLSRGVHQREQPAHSEQIAADLPAA